MQFEPSLRSPRAALRRRAAPHTATRCSDRDLRGLGAAGRQPVPRQGRFPSHGQGHVVPVAARVEPGELRDPELRALRAPFQRAWRRCAAPVLGSLRQGHLARDDREARSRHRRIRLSGGHHRPVHRAAAERLGPIPRHQSLSIRRRPARAARDGAFRVARGLARHHRARRESRRHVHRARLSHAGRRPNICGTLRARFAAGRGALDPPRAVSAGRLHPRGGQEPARRDTARGRIAGRAERVCAT